MEGMKNPIFDQAAVAWARDKRIEDPLGQAETSCGVLKGTATN